METNRVGPWSKPTTLVRAIARKVRTPASLAEVNGSLCSSARPEQSQGLQSRLIHVLKDKVKNETAGTGELSASYQSNHIKSINQSDLIRYT